MTPTATIRDLMADGRARTSSEIAAALGIPAARHVGQILRGETDRGAYLRFPAPTGQNPLWRINPNCLLRPEPNNELSGAKRPL